MKTLIRNGTLAAILAVFASVGGPTEAADPYKDLAIEQRPMVEAMPSATAFGSGDSISLTTTLNRADAIYKPGESVTLVVETSEDAYIWVLDTGTSGKVHQIFPNEYATDNFVRAGQAITLPGDDAEYQFIAAEPTGVELLTVIASRDSTPLTDGLVDQNTDAGPFLALLGTAASVSKDLQISIERQQSETSVSHSVFRIVE